MKQRFGDWIDARTAQGIETYGGPLTTDNGRDAERDMLEELLDFCQYQEQSRLELLADNARLRATYRRGAGTVGVAGVGEVSGVNYYNDDATLPNGCATCLTAWIDCRRANVDERHNNGNGMMSRIQSMPLRRRNQIGRLPLNAGWRGYVWPALCPCSRFERRTYGELPTNRHLWPASKCVIYVRAIPCSDQSESCVGWHGHGCTPLYAISPGAIANAWIPHACRQRAKRTSYEKNWIVECNNWFTNGKNETEMHANGCHQATGAWI